MWTSSPCKIVSGICEIYHHKKQVVEALCIRKISDRLSILLDINRHSHLTSLQLAEDFTDLSSTFDLLIMTSLMKWNGVVFNMIQALISPANPNEKSFDEILFVLEEHFSPQRSDIAKRTSQLFDKSSTKCRIVFDGSALFRNNSLNRQLDPGPPLQNDLVQILMRFRRFRIALQENDRDVTRCLWRDLGSLEATRIFRFKRVCFGLTCSPFLAMSMISYHALNHLQ
ncbi:hypothetical protein T12_13765 [Trichinella patagoniensis]|uniref:Uncharacterized protein n=1 Tax=Trichinella patagoniensis TaxID=990121 RepID=A0A0V1A406_9BILA|nr:hypothetical protein T12_13765 [Trichinella patagoniensis]